MTQKMSSLRTDIGAEHAAPSVDFDDVLHLASDICDTSTALVNLIGNVPASYRVQKGPVAFDMRFEGSICSLVLEESASVVIPDLSRDDRTADHLYVAGAPHLRFYAGVRLTGSGGRFFGTFSIMDARPRPGGLTKLQGSALERLGRQVVVQLELQQAMRDRDNTTAQMRDADIRHRQILDSAVDYGIITMTLDGTVTSWNTGAEVILGWSEEEMCGEPAHVFFTPEDVAADIPEQEMRSARERGRGKDERWHMRRDGSRFFALGEMMPLTSEGGHHVGYLKILRDRTWNRQIEEKLKLADERLQIALRASEVVGLWDWMVETDLLHGDANFARLYGLDVDATEAGLTMEEYQTFVVPAHLPDLRAKIRDTFENDADFLVEYALDIPGEPLRWVECRGGMVRDEDGTTRRFSGSAIDITARVEAEAETRKLAAIVEQSKDFIGVAALDGSVIMVNEQGRTLVGLTTEESVRTTRIQDYFDPEQWPEIVSTVFPAVNREGSWRGELRFRHFQTGELIPVVYDVMALKDARGEITSYATVTRDLRDQKKAEAQQRILNEELSHRMKNTLAMVQAIASQTLRGLGDKDALAAFTKRIQAIATAHHVLLQQSWEAADVEQVMSGVLGTFDMMQRFDISGPPLTLDSRAALSLSLLLHELATNALKYGALSVDAGKVSIVWTVVGDEVQMLWTEIGGPPAEAPARKGFGSKLINMGLLGTGGSELSYGPSGFTGSFKARLPDIRHN